MSVVCEDRDDQKTMLKFRKSSASRSCVRDDLLFVQDRKGDLYLLSLICSTVNLRQKMIPTRQFHCVHHKPETK